MRKRVRIGQAWVDCLTLEEACEQIQTLARLDRASFVVTPNSDHIVQLEDSEALRAVYRQADLVLADGMPLVWGSAWLGQPLPERVAGSELMPRLCARAEQAGLSVFLLGGPPGIAELALQRLKEKHPNLLAVGCYCPPFGFESNPEEEQKILQLLKASQPDLVFVGLGAPKQELWMARTAPHLQHSVLLGIGAAISFSAGSLKRAPRWMQVSGLEWAFRLAQEPKRLFARYLKDTKIFWILVKQAIFGGKD